MSENLDGNPDTVADPTWLPLNNTAIHPSWVSAHGGISGAAAATLANFFGTNDIEMVLAGKIHDGEPVRITAGKDGLMFNGETAKAKAA